MALTPSSLEFRVDGQTSILKGPLLGLCCSRQCPGRPILLAYDLAAALRDAGIVVISGFHTSVEKDCLDFLLKGTQPVVVVPARGPYTIVPKQLRPGLVQKRLAILYPFEKGVEHQIAALAGQRNSLVDALSAALFVIYAHKLSETLARAYVALDRGQPVFTFNIPENETLLAMGATGLDPGVARDPAKLRNALSWPNPNPEHRLLPPT